MGWGGRGVGGCGAWEKVRASGDWVVEVVGAFVAEVKGERGVVGAAAGGGSREEKEEEKRGEEDVVVVGVVVRGGVEVWGEADGCGEDEGEV